ncbi:hypothetical protein [Azospirillum argentinense]
MGFPMCGTRFSPISFRMAPIRTGARDRGFFNNLYCRFSA